MCFDVLTILACLMVVYFHCNGVIYNYSDTLSWKLSVVMRCVVYSAIPVFFMLSGAKLMNYRSRYTTKEYAKKRLKRVGIPFIFWNLFYVLYNVVSLPKQSYSSAKEFISQFLNSEFQSRFWFFWPLFAVYLAIPVISLVLEAENHRKYLWYAVYVSFGLSFCLKPILGILGIKYNSYLSLPVSAGFMVYVIFGYLVSTEKWGRTKRYVLYVSALASGVFAVYYTITKSALQEKTYQYMLSYEFFPSALTGASIFVFVKHLFEKFSGLSELSTDDKSVKIIRIISSACMGVWLTHSLGITAFLTAVPLDYTGYIFRFICPPIIFTGCVIVVLIIKKIPYIRNIV